ncbi:MAG TPA: efflux RND transporter periplasmic adaptor subunit [Candidatus Sulfotelmatobacter sp.]|nr:efflux RND transporter periplasmic adaptor subunit [Candidatus Sulfotelmatobacter sp.]
MRFGPTSLQVSSVLAKGLRRPKLRSDLRVSEQTVAGERSFVVKNPETNSYNRYGATEWEPLTLCDGTRTPAEIAQAMNERDPENPVDEAEVLDFLDSVEPAMWERSVGEKNLAVLERIRDERKSRLEQSSVLNISFKAWDPDKTLARLDQYLGWIFSRGFVVFSALLLIATLYFLAEDWARVQRDTASLYSFANKSAYDIWAFWILFFVLVAIHEFGHGLTCKHFGGDVHQMGFLLIYFTPAFFTDTTDIRLFQSQSHRQWVIFAGIWIEIVLCGISATIWHFTSPGSVVNDLAYKMMVLSGIAGTLMNLNPLIKADGYYALSQFLEIDNLREESFAFLQSWAQKHILRQDIDLPPASRRQRRIFLTFGISAFLYGVAVTLVTLIFVKNILVSKLGDWGYLATVVLVFLATRKSLRAALPAIRARLRAKREEYMAWKMTRPQAAGVVGIAFLLLIPPIPSKVSTDLMLEPGRDAHVRSLVDGRVIQVFVHPGDEVQPGQLLATLENPEIEADVQTISAQLALADSTLRNSRGSADFEKAAPADRDRNRLQQELAIAQKRVEELEIRAPLNGVITTPELEQRIGEFLSAGDEFCGVADRSTMKARILVRDLELQDVHEGAPAKVKVSPFPFRTYSGRVEHILPAAAPDRPVADSQKLEKLGQALTNYFAVEMVFPNPDGSLREGMTGTAKISGKSHPIAWQIARSGWRWFRSQVW